MGELPERMIADVTACRFVGLDQRSLRRGRSRSYRALKGIDFLAMRA